MSEIKNISISIIGPTASGKTSLAVALAKNIDGEIISIDSRQFYREMDIGTGKDLLEYGNTPYHLIDIADAGEQLNVSDFKKYFYEAYKKILGNNKTPILCGGTGNYLLSLLNNSIYTEIPKNYILRDEISTFSQEKLISILSQKILPADYNPDFSTKKRCIRALEIVSFLEYNEIPKRKYSTIDTKIFGLNPSIETRRENISLRLNQRLKNGLIEEVEKLLQSIGEEKLIYYGLEYKYIALYLKGNLTKTEAFSRLEVEIHRFAKRQMTFFRKIEKDGYPIHWLDSKSSLEDKINDIIFSHKKSLNS